jgi:WD40 repeat protein
VWDAATGLPLGEPFQGHTSDVYSVSFSPEGTRIVSGSWDCTVRVWDAATGQPLGEPFQGNNSQVSSVSFSPDGTRIVSGSTDFTVRVWDAATGLPLGEPFQGHTSEVLSVSFSPDGTRIVSGSIDFTVRLWNAATAQPFQEHAENQSSVSSLHRRPTTPSTPETIPLTNSWSNPVICFSSNLDHALQAPAELLENTSHHDLNSTPVLLDDGWMVAPGGQLLFWVPPARPIHYSRTVWTIPKGQEIDLSGMAHGEHWSNCRDPPTC